MALLISGVPDCRAALGPSQWDRAYDLAPGAISDYPSSGYPITANNVDLGELYGAFIIGTNAAGALYVAKFVLPNADLGAPSPQPATSLLMEVTVADVQVATGTDLSTCKWRAVFRGY
jgi:hypothetical protein